MMHLFAESLALCLACFGLGCGVVGFLLGHTVFADRLFAAPVDDDVPSPAPPAPAPTGTTARIRTASGKTVPWWLHPDHVPRTPTSTRS